MRREGVFNGVRDILEVEMDVSIECRRQKSMVYYSLRFFPTFFFWVLSLRHALSSSSDQKPCSTRGGNAARCSPYNKIGERERCTKEVGHTAALVIWLKGGIGVIIVTYRLQNRTIKLVHTSSGQQRVSEQQNALDYRYRFPGLDFSSIKTQNQG